MDGSRLATSGIVLLRGTDWWIATKPRLLPDLYDDEDDNQCDHYDCDNIQNVVQSWHNLLRSFTLGQYQDLYRTSKFNSAGQLGNEDDGDGVDVEYEYGLK